MNHGPLEPKASVLPMSDGEPFEITKNIFLTDQKEMITRLPKDKALYVEGGFRIWLREAQVSENKFFVLFNQRPHLFVVS